MPGNQINIPLETALRRLQLCTYALQEIHVELEEPEDPEAKADLLIAAENMVYEAVDLLATVKLYTWGPESEHSFTAPDDLT